jgi:hypothetical protein
MVTGETRIAGARSLDGLHVETECPQCGARFDDDTLMTPTQLRTLAQWCVSMARNLEWEALKGDSSEHVG